jgi:3-hydroxybutyrate dehydrogenase
VTIRIGRATAVRLPRARYVRPRPADDAAQARADDDVLVRAAIVTGAAGGIGRAVAERLDSEGVGVLAVDLVVDPTAPGEPFAADLTTREGNRASVEAAVERFGRLDVVVANAGFQYVAPVADFPEDRWDAMLALMLTSPFLLAKYAWEHLRLSGEGRFVAVASAHGLVASPYKTAYVAAKHGVLGLVKTLALEGAAYGIAATAVCPGYVRTPLVERQIASQAHANGIPEERVLEDVILAPHAVKRLIEPAEVAELVAFLAGPAGATITGTPVMMDAGWTAH